MTLPLILDNLFLFLDAESLIRYGGLLIICLVVYGSTGLFFCFFLPSGAVLFTAGVFVATGELYNDIYTVCSLLIAASLLGSMTGYAFGRKAGPVLYKRKESRFFRRRHLITAETFYKKHGGLALTAGYFLPVIRTFAPMVAGMINVGVYRYILFAFTGSVTWILSFVLAGYFMSSNPVLKPWIKFIAIGFILIFTIPVLIKIIREMRIKSGDRGPKSGDESLKL